MSGTDDGVRLPTRGLSAVNVGGSGTYDHFILRNLKRRVTKQYLAAAIKHRIYHDVVTKTVMLPYTPATKEIIESIA